MTTDPVVLLPAELVLRVLAFAPASAVAALTRTSKAWHDFIDGVNQDAIYAEPSKNPRPEHCRDVSYLEEHGRSFAKYWHDVASWKELCKRRVLLERSWSEPEKPVTRESVIQVGSSAVWRFRPDFRRRTIMSTSQEGGVNVTCMDSGQLLWRLDADEVRPYAHLEYEDGTAVWDRWGNALEVWRTDDSLPRGHYRRIAILPHDYETRGFQLSHKNLCVVSPQGQGYVYDMTQDPPSLTSQIPFESGAVGHLDQSADAVIYSVGEKGYHAYEKANGGFIGIINPKECENFVHINHPHSPPPADSSLRHGRHGPTEISFPPQHPRTDRQVLLDVQEGMHPDMLEADDALSLEDDEWGAGMVSGDTFVGVSRGGRALVCPQWRKCLQDQDTWKRNTTIIECESDGSTFDLGGWLHIYQNRIIFEIDKLIYIVALNEDGSVAAQPSSFESEPSQPKKSFAITTGSMTQFAVPVSFMCLADDCIMSTFTTLGNRRLGELNPADQRMTLFPTKCIRIVCLAPDLNNDDVEQARTEEASSRDEAQQEQNGGHFVGMRGALAQLHTLLF